MQRRSFSWVALVGIGLAGVVAVSAATALAARSAASPFEVVATYRYEATEAACPDCPPWYGPPVQTFTSGTPFCESGTFVGLEWSGPDFFRRYTCTDGSGSLTLAERQQLGAGAEWTIAEGSGRYAGLRGKGSYSIEELSDLVYRTTLQGVVDADAVAPTIVLASTKASKVKGKKGVYTIPVALEIRDNVEDNPVTYTVIVTRESGAGPWLASASGEAIGGVSFELRVRRPHAGVRAVLIRTTAVDPVGNESSLDGTVKLSR